MLPVSDEQFEMEFVVMAIGRAAQIAGTTPWELWRRLDRVGLVDGYLIDCFDVLHTQSLQHVGERTLRALQTWEKKEGVA